MMEDFIGTYGNRLIVAVVGVGVALLLLAIVLWFIRRRSGSAPFIRGGKNRQPRLQVLDATAVDARRRLVLVRRDNVEHLVMIGGPTDIVIESGIGAIPIVKDIRDPQQEVLQSLSAERAITSEKPKPLPPQREEETRPTFAATNAAPSQPAVPQPEKKQPVAASPVATVRPVTPPVPRPSAPAVTPSPSPAPAPTPLPARPPVTSAQIPAAAPRQRDQEDAPAIPRTIAREPVAPAVPATAVAATVAALPTVEPERPIKSPASAAEEQAVIPTPVAVAPEPVAAREPAIDRQSAVDFLDAARERVLPTFQTAPAVTAAASPKKEPLALGDNGPVFGDQLTSDFESFLEAEIAKNNAAGGPPVSLEVENTEQQAPEPAVSPSGDSDEERNVQKEMARIFGEMSVTRDR
ncbi:flagellar biosynthesis protein FliO [Agrobacterium larrymoorei]|nr:flagellar biosynthesis protein FliO [Agrobacterium larrymoorei]